MNDLTASLAWYEHALGFTVDRRHERDGRLVARGSTLDSAPTTAPWGDRFLRVRDPDGFRWPVSMPAARDITSASPP